MTDRIQKSFETWAQKQGFTDLTMHMGRYNRAVVRWMWATWQEQSERITYMTAALDRSHKRSTELLKQCRDHDGRRATAHALAATLVLDQIEHDLGFNEHNMRRDRPYNGQPHTDTGVRGMTEIRGVTFRDMRDCFIRAVLLSSHGISPAGLYDEATKGEAAAICENDLYGWDLNKLDPMAVAQNLACEIEKLMGIYPNVPVLTP